MYYKKKFKKNKKFWAAAEKEVWGGIVCGEGGGGGIPGAEIFLHSMKITVKQVVLLQPMQRTMGKKE